MIGADQIIEAKLLGEFLLQLQILESECFLFERALDGYFYFIVIERFRNVLVCPQLDPVHGVFDFAIRGYQKDYCVGILVRDRLQKVESVEPGHADVGDYDVGGIGLQHFQSRLAVLGGSDGITFIGHQFPEGVPGERVVVDDEDFHALQSVIVHCPGIVPCTLGPSCSLGKSSAFPFPRSLRIPP